MGALRNIFLFLFLALMSFQSTQEEEVILWSADYRLSWNDFKDKVPSGARAAAITASGITYRFSTSGTQDHMEVDFQIETHFYPNKSWYQPDLCDDVILSHEQLHFDISELFTRKLRKKLSEATYTYSNIKAKVSAIYRENNKELNAFQNRYDDETNFSRDREQQMIWNAEIKKALSLEN